MLAAMVHFNVDAFTHFYSDGERMTSYSRPAASQAHVLTCRDGKRIALHMSTPAKFWENLVRATGDAQLLERFPSREHRIGGDGEVIRALDAIFKVHDRAEWCRRLEAHDVPHSPVDDASEALDDPHARHLRLKVVTPLPGDGQFVTVRNPVIYDREPAAPVRPPPQLDEHHAELTRRAGST